MERSPDASAGRSSPQLGPGDGKDYINNLGDELLLLVLDRLGCFRAASRTCVLSKRWRSLSASVRHIVFRDVDFPSLEAALGRVPPVVPRLEIHVPYKEPGPNADAVNSLLCAAARLEPQQVVIALPWFLQVGDIDLSCFHRATSIALHAQFFSLHLPADINFPALKMLSLSGCLPLRLDSLLPSCPVLRLLRVKYNGFGHCTFISVDSSSLQELIVETEGVNTHKVDLAGPELKQLTLSVSADKEVSISILAPMLEKVSWEWCYTNRFIKFGDWHLEKLRLQKQGQFSSLHIHARIVSSFSHGEVYNFIQEIEKHMIAEISVLELHLKTRWHVFGALAFHVLGMKNICSAVCRLKVVLQRTKLKKLCAYCACDQTNWRSEIIFLTALEEVEINCFEGCDHEIDFLKMIFKCAPRLKRTIVRLSHDDLSRNDGCTQIYIIFSAYSSVECYLYLNSGLMHGSQECPST